MSGNGSGAAGPVTIAVAPNGGRKTKADHPAVPLSAAEIAETAAACREAGAAMIHVHVRDQEGGHLLDADAYGAVTKAIRASVGTEMVVQITTEAVGLYGPEEQMAVVRAVRPEAVSLALRELVPDAASEAAFSRFLGFLKKEAIMPQIILYAPDEADRLADLMARGVIPASEVPVLYVLGRYTAGQRSDPADLLPFLAPQRAHYAHWSVCAFGPRETACAAAAAYLGGHVRVGFENNTSLPDGSAAPDNAALVAATRTALMAGGLHPSSADDLRSSWQFA
ncbi:3-keto-5-aminohexanoate cleavage protein [Amorphus coralli]|uniref:3-keto-5-aminohexanoate cleavage protein n=1 Tax=Amorphus coralli TaxID=340680 RepID=UPI00035C95CD|nr:3-keto-5-aminohexanoate cleavage protein [Amorphus coralli]